MPLDVLVQKLLDGEHGRAVVARPLEGRARAVGAVDLDAVEPVLEAVVAAARGNHAGLVARGRRRRHRRQPRPARSGREACDVAAVGGRDPLLHTHLPHRAGSCRRVGAAERRLEQVGILGRRHLVFPHVQVDEVGAGAARRAQRGLGQVGLRQERRRRPQAWARGPVEGAHVGVERHDQGRLVGARDLVELGRDAVGRELGPAARRETRVVVGPAFQLDLLRARERCDRKLRCLQLAEDAVDVETAGREREVGLVRRRRDSEAARGLRRSGRADRVGRLGAVQVRLDVGLFVPVGVELDAALLHEDAGVALPGPEREPRVVARHRLPPHVT